MGNRQWHYGHKGRQSGQAAVEFALAVPLLLLVVVAVLYFGRYFLIAQTILHAAQEGARAASAIPITGSNDPNLAALRGFTGQAATNTNSPIYTALAAANLLSQGSTGNLPSGATVEILPWDATAGDGAQPIPQGTVAVRINYPFQFLSGPFGSGAMNTVAISLPVYDQNNPLQFFNFIVSQQAVAASNVYQNYSN